jgi:hypothetical protein
MVFRDVSHDKLERVRRDFLSKAGEALVSSLDYESTLANVARFAVPTLADWCAIDLLEPGAKASRQVAVAHVDENKVRFARELGERYPPDPDAPTGVPNVIRTGQSELYAEIPQELLERGARDAEHLRIIRDLQLRSGMVVPLRARGRIFGAIDLHLCRFGAPLFARRSLVRRGLCASRSDGHRELTGSQGDRGGARARADAAQRGRAGEPGQGRIPRHRLARAAHPR